MLLRAIILAVVVSFALTASADNKSGAALTKLPPKTVEINQLNLVHPRQPCPNWAWAAIVEMMLAQQEVTDLKQTDWVLKAYAGEVCIETPVSLETIKHAVEGEYVLLNGRKVRLQAVFAMGAPNDMGYVIQSLQNGTLLMMLWRGRPMVLCALEYDEYIYPNNQRMYEARKLTLADPVSGNSEIFDKLKDDVSEIGGIFELRVLPVER